MKKILIAGWALLMGLSVHESYAQFTFDGQLIQRAEFRNGFNVPIREGQDPGKFIAQRFRLMAGYEKEDLFKMFISVQDVRTWGNTQLAKTSDNLLSVHEAWGSTRLGEHTELKLGRQEVNYDNGRFLGALDWALQGRSHDIAMVKYAKEATKVDIGLAYNMNDISNVDIPYTVANQYKVAQLFRIESASDNLKYAFLVWNDGREQQVRNSAGVITDTKLHYRTTFGLPTLQYADENSQLSAHFYYQLGKDPVGRDVNAYNVALSFQRRIDIDADAGQAVTFAGGAEIMSGTRWSDESKNQSFSPLYGTNHGFNGYMDYFYVGGAHENSTGLHDYFVKMRYAPSKKWFMQGDVHVFSSQRSYPDILDPGNVVVELDRYFGTEFDLSVGVNVNDAVSFQGGYSHFLASDTFDRVKAGGLAKGTQNWAYVMMVFRPNMKNKFIGITL
jgi:hypothetical protein